MIYNVFGGTLNLAQLQLISEIMEIPTTYSWDITHFLIHVVCL